MSRRNGKREFAIRPRILRYFAWNLESREQLEARGWGANFLGVASMCDYSLHNVASRPARQHDDGQIDVCGWIRLSGNPSEQPFIGTLFGGAFAPERFGGNEVDNAQIFSDCRNRGAGIA